VLREQNRVEKVKRNGVWLCLILSKAANSTIIAILDKLVLLCVSVNAVETIVSALKNA
jgi:hypothetical protein